MANSFTDRQPAAILFAEDTEGDVILVRECFKRTSVPTTVYDVRNGVDCLAFLRKEGRYQNAPTPDLLLLDLLMPVMGGREVLTEIVADQQLKPLPVIVLSAYEQVYRELYQLGCNAYIVKPMDFYRLQHVIDEISAFWFGIATLPSQREAQ